MAFPAYQSSVETTVTGSPTSIDVVMPSGLSAGEKVIVIFAGFSDATTITPATGFSTIRRTNHTSFGAAMETFEKVADGSEGATQTFTLDADAPYVMAIRVSGGDPTSASSGTSADTGDPNSPSLTPAGGAKDFLWLTIGYSYNALNSSYAPASYTAIMKVADSTLGAAYSQLNASSTNPGAFAAAGSDGYIAQTIAVYPYVAPSVILGRGLLDGSLLRPRSLV